MFEGTGQPISGAGGPITESIEPGFPDLPTNSFFEYGINEDVPRLLNLFDKHGVKVSSFMIGKAVDKHRSWPPRWPGAATSAPPTAGARK